MALPIPPAPTPTVLSVDDVALRRGCRYATVLIDAVTHQRVDVLPDRQAATLTTWLCEHPGAEVVCRDGSAAYAEAIRQGAPQAVQVSDRWHLWHGLGGAVEKTVIAHSTCWRTPPPRQPSQPQQPSQPVRAINERTRARHAAVHELLGQGVGLLECARRLGWALNTVKRYTRAATAEQLQRPPRYGRTLVDPYRDHLRRRLADDPGVPVTPAARRDPRAGLHRQRQPAGALPQPGPRPGRARSPATASPRRLDHEQARRAGRPRPQSPRRAAARPSPSSPSTSAPSPSCPPPGAATIWRTG